jgi:hypothetical protein
MADVNLEKELGRDAGCPSEMLLDRFHWGELGSEESGAIGAHLEQCSVCRQRMALRQQGFEAFGELDPVALRVRIQGAVTGERGGSARRSWLPGWVAWLAGSAAAAVLAVLVVIAAPWKDEPGAGNGVRAKGSVKLSVFRERAGKVEEAISGDTFLAGDRLRFRVDLPEDGEIMVVGVEQSGAVYPCYPLDGSRASRASRAGTGLELAGAIRLDASLGNERIHLVWCPERFSIGDIEAGDSPGKLALPAGCLGTTFGMRKAER